jgi:hypothetical protein
MAVPAVTAAVNNADDIVDVLLAQHLRLRQLCSQLQEATGRKRHFGDLAVLVHLHELGEQVVVHPMTRDRTGSGGNTVGTACVAQEDQAGRAIAALADLGVDHPSFPTRFAAFHQAFLDHLTYEEREEFPRLRRRVPAQELHMMANAIRNVQAMP